MVNIKITEEQCKKAYDLALYAIKYHTVTDIFKNDDKNDTPEERIKKSFERKFIGTLGEILYADYYGFQRPTKAFGAVDGQDFGKDFSSPKEPQKAVDIKTMRRGKVDNIKPNWVANLEKRQLFKNGSLTDNYFIITIDGGNYNWHPKNAVLCGYIPKEELISKAIFYPAGSVVQNDWGKEIRHVRDTYEIQFKHLYEPWDPNN